MSRVSRLSHLLTVAAATAIVTALPARPVAAEQIVLDFAVGEADDDEELVMLMFDTDTGARWVEVYYKDGTADAWPLDNPNPDDPSSGGGGDLDMALALLKQNGGNGLGEQALEDTPLGEHLTGSGQGLAPVHNPSDEDGPHAQSTSSIKFENPAGAYEEMFEGAGYPTAPGFDGNGGSMGGQIADALRRGKKSGSGGDGGNENPNNHGFYDDSMPGPPELVNPAWSTWTPAEREAYLELMALADEEDASTEAAAAKRQ
jgi:hypothetical protein